MPRKPVLRSNTHYYYITSRSDNSKGFYLTNVEVWLIMVKELRLLQIEYDLKIRFFRLSSDRFHLLLRSPLMPIDWVMYLFMKNTTRRFQKNTGRINKIYGSHYKACLIPHEEQCFRIFQYLERLGNNEYKSDLNFEVGPQFKGLSEIEPGRIEWGLTRTVFKLRSIRL